MPPSASPSVAGNKPASQRDRSRLWLSRLHSFRTKVSTSVRLPARRPLRKAWPVWPTEQCAPVLVKVRHGLTTSNRQPPKSSSQMRQQKHRALGCFATRRRIMINKAKLALVAAVAALFASPALAQSLDGHHSIGREMGSRHAGAHHTHRNGLNAYASQPRLLLLSPAFTKCDPGSYFDQGTNRCILDDPG
jgi:hypothetical protein